jgi:hypothetical protein
MSRRVKSSLRTSPLDSPAWFVMAAMWEKFHNAEPRRAMSQRCAHASIPAKAQSGAPVLPNSFPGVVQHQSPLAHQARQASLQGFLLHDLISWLQLEFFGSSVGKGGRGEIQGDYYGCLVHYDIHDAPLCLNGFLDVSLGLPMVENTRRLSR